MARKKLKEKGSPNKITGNKSSIAASCFQNKEDILFEFGHVTTNKAYSYEALVSRSKNEKNIFSDLSKLIKEISSQSWLSLASRRKEQFGGFEFLPVAQFKTNVCTAYKGPITSDTKLCIFRFGTGDKYRLVVCKSPFCPRVVHILAFDLDFSLYDHG